MKFLLGSAVSVICLLEVALASTAQPPPPATTDVWPKPSAAVTTEGESSTRPFAEDCQDYCSCTYPVHTYPEPVNLKACTSGCRSAQLDAFISWPLSTDPQKCEKACQEMYSDEDQRFACSTGCTTPTIDSTFPNRDHLYSEEMGNWTAEIDILLPPIKDTISYIFNSFFGSPMGFDELNEHAQNMETLTVPYLRSDITILTNDGVYSYREYSFNNGDPVFAPPSGDKEGSSYIFPTGPEVEVVGEEDWMGIYARPGRSNCMWLLHRAALNKMVLVLSVGLIMTALLACLLSSCKTPSSRKSAEKVPPKVIPTKMSPQITPLPLVKKAPYNVGPTFALPEKVKLDTVKIAVL